MSAVLTASITNLCAADHRDRPEAIASWTANKTPDGVRRMMQSPGTVLFVALVEESIAAVGAVMGGTTIALNYVSPRYRFRGVSKALLAHMEGFLREGGAAEGVLDSTETAHGFYLSCGWIDAGPPEPDGFATCYPMRKVLVP